MSSNENRVTAFEKVFRELYPSLCVYATSIIHNDEDARDIVSQVFVHLWTKIPHIKWDIKLKSYLFQCVHHAALNSIRAEKVRYRFFKFLQEEESLIEEEAIIHEDLLQRIEKLIEQMPPQMKAIFLLNRFEGKSCEEIAKKMNLSIRTVENHVYRAMNFLRKELQKSSPAEWLLFIFLLRPSYQHHTTPSCENME